MNEKGSISLVMIALICALLLVAFLTLGGTVSQFYLICAIDTENNIIWYLETDRK